MVQAQEHHHPLSFSGRLKYANPRSLPSYPSHGHSRNASSSSASAAAAALGRAKHNHSSGTKAMTEHRETSQLPSAAALAASIAADPRSSSLQNGPGPRHGLGGSAATQAFGSRSSPRATPRVTPKNSSSLAAAQIAARPRSMSSPILRQGVPGKSPAVGSGRGDDGTAPLERSETAPRAVGIPRSMYTSRPPVSLEVEEKRRAEELHVSTVAMAKNLFKQQSRLTESFPGEDDDPRGGASRGAVPPGQNPNLQEAAYRLAHERLSKLHDEHQKNREFQDYYTTPSGAAPRRRSTIAAKLRRRSSSAGDIDLRAGGARNRASLFSPTPPNRDERARDKDREHVLAAARKNVRAQLDDMDQAVADRTGMVPASSKSVWESKAHALAQARLAAATAEDPHGAQRDVGGGRYVEQGEIEAVAAKNVKPVLLEMDERAEKERDRQRALKEEEEVRKAHKREVKENLRKLKAEQKEKDRERQQIIKEEQRIWRHEDRVVRRKEVNMAVADLADDARTSSLAPGEGSAGQGVGGSHEGAQRTELPPRRTTPPNAGNVEEGEGREQALSPGKVKSWLKAKLTRQKPSLKARDDSELGKGFVGGHVLRSPDASRAGSSTALPGVVAYHDVKERAGPEGQRPPVLQRGVSSGTDGTFEDARESVSPPKTPPRIFVAGDSRSPTRDSRFKEIMD
ncbi:uncharacterized protein DNG_03444 [Cephalotrichum gorgonifer]|uniref:Uncharacterized protein n=1 Tax=Cephalotrichum gorgonifer TaxID=2041049 RepID=A0AAE8MWJ6_9PEZI|nr:uncharacterized protein DNG_03444 [Cephalotrichum gorgonifer]